MAERVARLGTTAPPTDEALRESFCHSRILAAAAWLETRQSPVDACFARVLRGLVALDAARLGSNEQGGS